jgi:hypothetical protein
MRLRIRFLARKLNSVTRASGCCTCGDIEFYAGSSRVRYRFSRAEGNNCRGRRGQVRCADRHVVRLNVVSATENGHFSVRATNALEINDYTRLLLSNSAARLVAYGESRSRDNLSDSLRTGQSAAW